MKRKADHQLTKDDDPDKTPSRGGREEIDDTIADDPATVAKRKRLVPKRKTMSTSIESSSTSSQSTEQPSIDSSTTSTTSTTSSTTTPAPFKWNISLPTPSTTLKPVGFANFSWKPFTTTSDTSSTTPTTPVSTSTTSTPTTSTPTTSTPTTSTPTTSTPTTSTSTTNDNNNSESNSESKSESTESLSTSSDSTSISTSTSTSTPSSPTKSDSSPTRQPASPSLTTPRFNWPSLGKGFSFNSFATTTPPPSSSTIASTTSATSPSSSTPTSSSSSPSTTTTTTDSTSNSESTSKADITPTASSSSTIPSINPFGVTSLGGFASTFGGGTKFPTSFLSNDALPASWKVPVFVPFGSKKKSDSTGGEDDDGGDDGDDNDGNDGNDGHEADDASETSTKPAFPIDAKASATGEENEDIVLKIDRAKLYKLVPRVNDPTEKEWRERGIGDVHVNVLKENPNRSRIVMRAEKTKNLLLNAMFFHSMDCTMPANNSLRFSALEVQSADVKPVLSLFLIRMSDKPRLQQLYDKIRELKDACTPGTSTTESSKENDL